MTVHKAAEWLEAIKLATDEHVSLQPRAESSLHRLARSIGGTPDVDPRLRAACTAVLVAGGPALTDAAERLVEELRRVLAEPTSGGDVLLVEDDPVQAAWMLRALGSHFPVVRHAATAAAARSAVQSARPRLILLDLVLPDEDGRELLADWTGLRPAPAVVIVSGMTPTAVRTECLALGAREMVAKPLDGDLLRAVVEPFLSDRAPSPTPAPLDLLALAADRARDGGPWALLAVRAEAMSGAPVPVYDLRVLVALLARAFPAATAITPLGPGSVAGVVPVESTGPSLEARLLATVGALVSHDHVVAIGACVATVQPFLEVARVALRMAELAHGSGEAVVVTTLRSDHRAKVLLAEDDPDMAAVMARVLTGVGLDVTHVSDGDDALGVAERRAFDLIVLDVEMPRRSGLQVLRALRSNARHARTPIVLCTGVSSEQRVVDGFDAGADEYITKPFAVPLFVARIRALLARRAPTP